MRLKNEVAVITGASRGIGLAIAKRFAAEGASVVITARDSHALHLAQEELKRLGCAVLAVPGDVTSEADVAMLAKAVHQTWGSVDIVVNNAGSARSEAFLKTDRAFWDQMLAINATSAFLISRAFLPAMVERKKGRIVMVASISSKKGAPYVAAYSAAKHAMLGLARSLAEEFRGKGIYVNSVCPGYVDTPMTGRSVENIVKRTGKTEAEARAALAAMNPQKRLITPEEVAERVLAFAESTCTKTGEADDL